VTTDAGRAFVYILQHAKEERIKIGRSVAPFSRARSLPDTIDYGRSLQLQVESRWAGRVEKTLHFVARDLAVSLDQKGGDGASEWFEARALPIVVAFIERNPEMFPNGGFVALEQPRIDLSTHAARRAAERAQWEARVEQTNRETIEALRNFVAELGEIGRLCLYRDEGDALLVREPCDDVDAAPHSDRRI
jgi:hypothetical protein